ncbi:MAG: ATP-grasp ribosomal peptide maturase [Pseudonocardiaceae bacterium]
MTSGGAYPDTRPDPLAGPWFRLGRTHSIATRFEAAADGAAARSGMPADRPVLVLTQRMDATADLVIEELHRRGVPVVRLDTGDFPQRMRLAARLRDGWAGTLAGATRSLHLDAVRSVYYRRPTMIRMSDRIPEAALVRAREEARRGLGGVLAGLRCWINHPFDVAAAEFKPVQLAAARTAGLTVPETLITNDPAEIRAFAADCGGRIVVKPLSAPDPYDVRKADLKMVYTTLVPESDIGDPAVALTATMFQQWVPKRAEVRLTAVDGALFAAEITTASPRGLVDWRSDYASLSYRTVDVPDGIRAAVLRLLGRFGLRYAAMDFIVTPDGEWVFLEVNPSGQWAWIEQETGLPLTAAIANALEAGEPGLTPCSATAGAANATPP